ncbi:MAG: helix-turn-helix domain-containing protein [Actinophytocola sp.]|nr:helix-turn-helix domain-containing protein [Actinophytocola sp.]
MSQDQLARRGRTSRTTLSAYERGHRCCPAPQPRHLGVGSISPTGRSAPGFTNTGCVDF